MFHKRHDALKAVSNIKYGQLLIGGYGTISWGLFLLNITLYNANGMQSNCPIFT